jgi:RNA polymerase sigma factor (TIGR02999 family)
MAADRDITGLLQDWRRGDRAALEQLVPLVEDELRRIARRRIGSASPEESLTTTSLVQEAYVRVIGKSEVNWQGRTHFFALCAEIMRGILVDHARARQAVKRGGGAPHLPLEEDLLISEDHSGELVAIDEALQELAKVDPRKGKVVELRFFGGLTVEETAEALSISQDTVLRDWRVAKIWLMRQMEGAAGHGAG